MSQSANDLVTNNGLFKIVYASKTKDLIPDGVKVLKEIDFVPQSERQGESYRQPVILGMEHGFSYGGTSGAVFNLAGSISGNTVFAEVKGTEMILESTVSLGAVSRSENKQAAFVQATKHVVKNMMLSMYKRLEVQMLYGQMGLGAVASTSGNVITITAAEWAPGIWNGGENMKLELRSSAGAVRGSCSITKVDSDNRQLTVDLLPAGVVATDVLWHAGAYGKEFAGIHKILTNTSTLFGIDASQYNLWKGNTYTISPTGPLSFDAVKGAISLAVNKGLDGTVMALVSTKSWDKLLTEQAALRMYDSSYSSKELEQGAEKITFFSQNGKVEVVPSIHVKEGYAYIISKDEFKRVGSSDVTFDRPGMEGQYIIDLQQSSGYGIRAYSDQALFCEAPGRGSLISAIS
jgi:hypothetical protein